jgi:hypothetical protein
MTLEKKGEGQNPKQDDAATKDEHHDESRTNPLKKKEGN